MRGRAGAGSTASEGASARAGALRILFYLSVFHFIGLALVTSDQALLDQHAFRQTYTAISVYYLLQGGDWLAYETPVLGAPWTVPFEFPLFQWLVALLTTTTPLSIEAAGRWIAAAFTLACLVPARAILSGIGFGRPEFLLFGALFLFAPVHMFWGRAFMIETTALFFALAWLAGYMRFLQNGSPLAWGVSLVGACAAGLVKLTTFPAFALAGAALTVWRAGTMPAFRPMLARYLMAGATVAVALLVAIVWLRFADAHKSGNLLSEYQHSARLIEWHYGTLDQRLSPVLWFSTIMKRSLSQAVGLGWLVAAGLVAYLGSRHRSCRLAAAALGAYLLPFLLFTNLHIVHNYYQTANAVFAIAAVTFVLAAVLRKGATHFFYPALATTVATQLMVFYLPHNGYADSLARHRSSTPTLEIAQAISRHTPPESVIMVFGIGWSPEIHFYAERRGIAMPYEAAASVIREVGMDPGTWTDGAEVGAIVDCSSRRWSSDQRAAIDALIARLAGAKPSQEVSPACKLYLLANDEVRAS